MSPLDWFLPCFLCLFSILSATCFFCFPTPPRDSPTSVGFVFRSQLYFQSWKPQVKAWKWGSRKEGWRGRKERKKETRKERKLNFEHSCGAMCLFYELLCYSLWEYSAHIKNHSGGGEIRGRWWEGWGGGGLPLTSKRLLSLQAIFNWTLIRYLPGPSSFWSRRGPWQLYACLKASGRHVHALVLYLNPSADTDTGLQIYTCKAAIRYCFSWQANLKSSIEMQVLRCIKKRPDETKYHD